jgi:hypothetical protein
MTLPIEIRLFIYSYLIPNATVPSGSWKEEWEQYGVWVRLRHDRKPCRLALLQTNRMIYYEMVELLYSSTCYSLWLEKNNLRFVNRNLSSVTSLPFGFQFITRLSLTVKVAGRSLDYIRDHESLGYSSEKEALQHLSLVTEISNFFSSSGPGSLQNLHLRLHFGPTFFLFLFLLMNPLKTPPARDLVRTTIWKSLEFNFDSLRNIRVSRGISMDELMPLRAIDGCFGQFKEDVIAVKTEYFDLLENEISGAYDEA